MKRLTLFAFTVLALGAPAARAEVDPAVLRAETERIAVMDTAKDAVLAIFSSTGRGGGSGVVISPDGYALTNFHVVKPCGNAMKCGMADGELYDAVIVGVDPTGDVALIKLFGRDDFPHAELGDSDQLVVGDWCFAMGNPFLLATNFQPTVTYGIVSGTHRYQYPAGTLLEYADCIQTDASINPGNSGGPLFNGRGQLIGINGRGSFEKRGRVNVGVAYAVSINQIKNFLGHLRGGRIVDHATLGALVGFDDEGRVVVVDILEESDAYRRGLRYGDEVVTFGGRPITTPNALKNVLGIFPKGWRVPLSYRRDSERYDVMVRLAGVHGREELIKKTEGRPQPSMPIPEPKDEDDEDEEGKKPDDEGEGPRIIPFKELKRQEKPGEEGPEEGEGKEAEKPEDGEKKDDDKPPRPQHRRIPIQPGDPHHPMRRIQMRAPMPEVCKKHFEEKRGYANYYFNKLHRDRVLDAWRRLGDFRGLRGAWALAGEAVGTGEIRFELTDSGVLLTLPRREYPWTAGEELGSSPDPPQSGGLLPALYLWRKLAVLDPGDVGDVSYLGTVPLPGHEGLVDALSALSGGAESRFLFDPEKGNLLAVEFFAAEDVDPCEVYFSDYREVEGRQLPGHIEVRVGDVPYATFLLSEFRFEKAADASDDEND